MGSSVMFRGDSIAEEKTFGNNGLWVANGWDHSVTPRVRVAMEIDVKTRPTVQQEVRPMSDAARRAWLLRVGSALFYGGSSLVITLVNKTLLTGHGFPSFQMVALGQMSATVLVLLLARHLGVITLPPLRLSVLSKMWPLPLVYLGNMVFGLGGTKELSIPMQIVLRRFSVLMTMISEFYWLNVKTGPAIQVTVYAMIGGSILAAAGDLGFSLVGYIMVLLNNVCTTASGILIKSKLCSKEFDTFGFLFYNSFLMLPPCALWALLSGEMGRALDTPLWSSPAFVAYFVASSVMGLVLAYATLLCTKHNSALTTTVVGCLKSICTTYLGMFIGGDYAFSLLNFVGINISVVGSLAYSWVTFRPPRKEISDKTDKNNT